MMMVKILRKVSYIHTEKTQWINVFYLIYYVQLDFYIILMTLYLKFVLHTLLTIHSILTFKYFHFFYSVFFIFSYSKFLSIQCNNNFYKLIDISVLPSDNIAKKFFYHVSCENFRS